VSRRDIKTWHDIATANYSDAPTTLVPLWEMVHKCTTRFHPNPRTILLCCHPSIVDTARSLAHCSPTSVIDTAGCTARRRDTAEPADPSSRANAFVRECCTPISRLLRLLHDTTRHSGARTPLPPRLTLDAHRPSTILRASTNSIVARTAVSPGISAALAIKAAKAQHKADQPSSPGRHPH
jgi:hypothetical protein